MVEGLHNEADMSNNTQKIVNYMEEHGSITSQESAMYLGIPKITNYIRNAQKEGYDITEAHEHAGRVTFDPNGGAKRMTTRYFLNDVCEVV